MSKRVIALFLNVFAILVILVWLALQASPASEMTRLRNALLFSVGDNQDFNWTPKTVPDSFQKELADMSTITLNFQAEQHYEQQWQQVVATVNQLRRNTRFGKAIQSDTNAALNLIMTEGRGYCADYTQVINALSFKNEIFVREWGMSFDGYGGWGHAFSEFYIEEWQKWVFFDTYNGFYVEAKSAQYPLSVQEFRTALVNAPETLQIIRVEGKFGFKSDSALVNYYLRGVDQFYLWWANNSLSYDNNFLIQWAAKLGRPVEQLTAILIGVHPKIKALPLENTQQQREHMLVLQQQLIIAALALVLLSLVSCYLLVSWVKSRRKTISKGTN